MTSAPSTTPIRSSLAHVLLQLKEDKSDNADLKADSPKSKKKLTVIHETESRDSNSVDEAGMCNCRKSRCLKLYCQCFAAKITCTSTCNCLACLNTVNNVKEREDAVKSILERNPNAFESKFKAASSTSVAHKIGCRCRKSMCLKKYCECFQAGVPCSMSCTCIQCCNSGSGNKTQKLSASAAVSTPNTGKPVTSTPNDSVIRAANDLAYLRSTVDDDALHDFASRMTAHTTTLNSAEAPQGKRKRYWIELADSQMGERPSILARGKPSIRTASPNSLHCATALSLLSSLPQLHPTDSYYTDERRHSHDGTSEEDVSDMSPMVRKQPHSSGEFGHAFSLHDSGMEENWMQPVVNILNTGKD